MTTGRPKHVPANERICSICGKVYYSFPSKRRATCASDKCMARRVSISRRTHGESRSRLYNIWCHMKSRCKGTSGQLGRKYYSSRGVIVCDEWNDFEKFKKWSIENGYDESLELDRREPNGNYEPSNCRWATRMEQMRNTRKRGNAKTSIYKGVSKHSQNKSWVAQGYRDGRPVNIGSYKTEIDAAKAYDAWARVNYGDFARLNFSDISQGGVSR